ncbi:MAG: Hsp20 family protein [Candidatus Scalindua rubra]|uniref:Hsp20/alpha crystallin family protein n=1 Tax=Candidatus Scalindua brodae TaxID=237368 RepID=A0A0B0EM27_9BACT|nr:MAG: Hsp20/alpha crystallin family protein [Candidatus Scalindua brodae]MBZ0109398.1 Hsp20 family protein [Candidatus Scalindua rubra]TWU34814.1 Hsp20/alpha crystallin family protein [Candidatus Brocadiaceae bacterium S225]
MLKYQITIGVLCFALGAAVIFAVQNYRTNGKHDINTKNKLSNHEGSMDKTFDSFFDDDFFMSSKSPFEEMRRMQESMMRQFNQYDDDSGSGIFGSWFKKRFGGGEPGDIQTREDEDFVYYDVVIKDLSNKKLDIKVEDGQIKISGTVEKRSDDKGKNTNSSKFYSSTFHRSFPVPYGVDGDRVQMEQDDEKIIIKLPKVK